ncbi:2-C-methyl-D-erythritol 4-phosphate cytidylyltransferase, partial [Actibacterium sp.]|uniref:IspD/TarI family cytidylyltransferase n=1 Tax=Actibacterium sp. TaxID=1872125 RepID=UPI0035682574
MRTAAIIVAAGRGTRAGGEIPKQYQPLRDQPVLARTVAAFVGHPGISQVIAVIHPADDGFFSAALGTLADRVVRVHGADSRDGSVRAGLAAVAPDCDAVLIHDGARPLVNAALI